MTRRSLFNRLFSRQAGTPDEDSGGVPGEVPPQANEWLRPPGAVPEPEFLDLCERCTECRDACSWDVILPLGAVYGNSEGTPAIMPWQDACRLCEDLPCIDVCPSGALSSLPLEQVRMGTAILDPTLCLAVQGETCDPCVKACPVGDKAMVWDGDRPRVLAEGCTGCGMCVEVCPAQPRALAVRPVQR